MSEAVTAVAEPAIAQAPAEVVPQAAQAATTPSQTDKDREVFDRLMAGPQNTETKPAVVEQSPEPVQESDPPAEAAQPDLSEITGDKGVAKYVEVLGINPEQSLDLALAAYQRDGVYDEADLRERFKANPVQFVEKGLKRLKAQRDQDEYGREYRAWKASQKSQPATPSDPSATASQPQPAPQQATQATQAPANPDFRDAIEKLLEPIDADELTAPLKGPLTEALSTVTTQVVNQVKSEYEQRLAQVQAREAAMQAQIVEATIRAERARLANRYPGLNDDAAFQRVLDRYDTLADTGRFKTVEETFAEASRWELGESTAVNLRNQLLADRTQRKAGQPRTTLAASENSRTLPKEEQERLSFQKLYAKHYGPLAQ